MFCTLILLSFVFPVFPWQIEPFQKEEFPPGWENQTILNIVFIPLGYQKKDSFKKDVFLIITYLKNTPPFNQFKGFRFYILSIASKEKNILFKKSQNFPYLEVRNDLISGIKNELNYPYKLVVLDKQINISAAEVSNAKATSIIILGRNSYGRKNRLAKVFLHELGHSLGLREENPGSSQPIIFGPPNCAPDKETAKKWWGDLAKEIDDVGYFKILSGNKTFIKPTRSSIMNNPFKSSRYGPVNERYLCQELKIPVTLYFVTEKK